MVDRRSKRSKAEVRVLPNGEWVRTPSGGGTGHAANVRRSGPPERRGHVANLHAQMQAFSVDREVIPFASCGEPY